ncbi:hypothetical protein L3Q82_006911 [Scortum barcoo]|uniref:Uncharacterized protein n=1 Tax=Scortum barcoo TaxID=214431 RepID=A0ACB8WVK6_9TELE|nr:hypothetical protein L3Q82_006911 [Scortum barcoo]
MCASRSTLGEFLSEKLGWPLHEGDNFHPKENIEKMTRGEPLTDQTRSHGEVNKLPWGSFTRADSENSREERCSGSDALVTCSALKRLYRQILLLLHGSEALASFPGPDPDTLPPAPPDVFFLFLYGDYDFLYQRMVARKGHYMKSDLLRSQFDILEPPLDEENVLPLDVRSSIACMAAEVERHIVRFKSSLVP